MPTSYATRLRSGRGRAFNSAADRTLAMALQRQIALRDDPAAGARNDGYVFEEIGENLLAQGFGGEARPSFARAFALLKDDASLKANEAARLALLKLAGP
ncbi:MAG: hypothetical protein ABI831_10165 [Betaproteobacteria bacterium]